MRISIAPAQIDQAADIREILIEAAQWLQDIKQPMWSIERFDHEWIQAEVAAGSFLIAHANGVSAGTARVQLSDREFWPDLPEGDSVFLHQLAVRRRFAGQGVSLELLRFAAAETGRLGRRYVRLDCVVDRAPLRRFYERAGFRHHSDFVAGPWRVARYEVDLCASTAIHGGK